MIRFDVTTKGPVFSGQAPRVMRAAADEAEQLIAEEGVQLVRRVVQSRARRRTGRYERHVRVDRAGAGREVNDGKIVYGPWLEGVSARNQKSRFKGMQQFRKATQQLNRRATEVAQPAVERAVRKLS